MSLNHVTPPSRLAHRESLILDPRPARARGLIVNLFIVSTVAILWVSPWAVTANQSSSNHHLPVAPLPAGSQEAQVTKHIIQFIQTHTREMPDQPFISVASPITAIQQDTTVIVTFPNAQVAWKNGTMAMLGNVEVAVTPSAPKNFDIQIRILNGARLTSETLEMKTEVNIHTLQLGGRWQTNLERLTHIFGHGEGLSFKLRERDGEGMEFDQATITFEVSDTPDETHVWTGSSSLSLSNLVVGVKGAESVYVEIGSLAIGVQTRDVSVSTWTQFFVGHDSTTANKKNHIGPWGHAVLDIATEDMRYVKVIQSDQWTSTDPRTMSDRKSAAPAAMLVPRLEKSSATKNDERKFVDEAPLQDESSRMTNVEVPQSARQNDLLDIDHAESRPMPAPRFDEKTSSNDQDWTMMTEFSLPRGEKQIWSYDTLTIRTELDALAAMGFIQLGFKVAGLTVIHQGVPPDLLPTEAELDLTVSSLPIIELLNTVLAASPEGVSSGPVEPVDSRTKEIICLPI